MPPLHANGGWGCLHCFGFAATFARRRRGPFPLPHPRSGVAPAHKQGGRVWVCACTLVRVPQMKASGGGGAQKRGGAPPSPACHPIWPARKPGVGLRAASHPRAPIEGEARKGGAPFPLMSAPPFGCCPCARRGRGAPLPDLRGPLVRIPQAEVGGPAHPSAAPRARKPGGGRSRDCAQMRAGARKKGGRGGAPSQVWPPVSVLLPACKPWGGRFRVCACPPIRVPPLRKREGGPRPGLHAPPSAWAPSRGGGPLPIPTQPPICVPCWGTKEGGGGCPFPCKRGRRRKGGR